MARDGVGSAAKGRHAATSATQQTQQSQQSPYEHTRGSHTSFRAAERASLGASGEEAPTIPLSRLLSSVASGLAGVLQLYSACSSGARAFHSPPRTLEIWTAVLPDQGSATDQQTFRGSRDFKQRRALSRARRHLETCRLFACTGSLILAFSFPYGRSHG
jgi:hypothetical protein